MAGREQEDVVSIELSSEINSVLDDNRGIAKSYGEVCESPDSARPRRAAHLVIL